MRKAVVALVVCLGLGIGGVAQAGNWGFSIGNHGLGIGYGSGHHGHGHHGHGYGHGYGHGWGGYGYGHGYYAPTPYYNHGYGYSGTGGWNGNSYYPRHNPNPVVRRNQMSYDNPWSSGFVTEDRRASYYSPGRNQAVTPPQTNVYQQRLPDGSLRTNENTSWIGADGRPHSTNVDRVQTYGADGRLYENTHVELKKKQSRN